MYVNSNRYHHQQQHQQQQQHQYHHDGRDSGDSGGAEKEVASRSVQVQSKRFYLDVKQNRRGRFLKIAEVGASGQKTRILMSMSATPEFRDKVNDLLKHYKQAESSEGGSGGGGNGEGGFKIRSETISRDNRRYYLDLKENQRGKFLRIAQQVSPSGMRTQIALPAQGIEEMRDRLVELIEECGTDDMADGVEQLPGPKSLRVDNKMFYFDIGANRRGTFLRLSEVRANFRTAVTVPEKSWAAVRDIIDEYIAKTKASAAAATSAESQDGKTAGAAEAAVVNNSSKTVSESGDDK